MNRHIQSALDNVDSASGRWHVFCLCCLERFKLQTQL